MPKYFLFSKSLNSNPLMRKLHAFVVLTLLTVGAAQAQNPIDPFLGRWSLYLPGGAGWLEVKQADGSLDADLLLFGGGVEPCSNVYMDGQTLVVTRTRKIVMTKGADGKPLREQTATELNRFSFFGDQLVCEQIRPEKDGTSNTMRYIGKKIPNHPTAPDLSKLTFGKPIQLFSGKDLTGWKLTSEKAVNGWKAMDGNLTNNPVQEEGKPHINYGNLRTEQEFEDFNLKVQVTIPAGSNSGIYLRGIYEVQVADSYGKPLDSHNMGGLYSRLTPSVAAEKPAGSWQDFDITLCDRHVTVILNGKKIIDNQPVLGITGGALSADEFKPGPIYLQGDHGTVSYRNLVLTPIVKK
jgi:Domain of Unknown Function (DUF1080)